MLNLSVHPNWEKRNKGTGRPTQTVTDVKHRHVNGLVCICTRREKQKIISAEILLPPHKQQQKSIISLSGTLMYFSYFLQGPKLSTGLRRKPSVNYRGKLTHQFNAVLFIICVLILGPLGTETVWRPNKHFNNVALLFSCSESTKSTEWQRS